ncbi:MAG TPA: SRPBCC domain-containing protein [Caulobacteraceae bacterium]|jgi:uncharacterized protein YndB with AHSA1/START domain|nr:SRPBCC domain-containing protein [Caulobacteraceae bacterium]
MAEAELARFVDRDTMLYERTYPHPIDRVWRAIVEPAEFSVWFIPGRLDLRVGGRYWFGDDGYQGAVEAIEPPRLLRLRDDKQDLMQYALAAVAGGTRLQFTHHIPPGGPRTELPDPGREPRSFILGGDHPGDPDTPWKPGFVAGYHGMFDDLADLLDGVATGSRLPDTELGHVARWWADYPPPSARDLTPEQRDTIARSMRLRQRWFELIEVYRDHIAATIPPADPAQKG